MHWGDNKLKKGQRRSIGASPITSASEAFPPSSPVQASSPTMVPQGFTSSSSPSAVRADQNHPTVVAPPSQLVNAHSSPTKSPSKARSFFRHGHASHQDANSHTLNTNIPSPSLNMGGIEQAPTDDATLLHIKLKQEAQERALRTSGASSGSAGSYGYDGQSIYSPAEQANTVKGHNRTSSLGASTQAGGAGGGVNAGWYMTTGVLPAVIQTPLPDNLSRSGSLGQRSKLSQYGSLYDATGLDKSGARRSSLTGNTGSPGQQKELPRRPVSPEYVQSITGLRSQLLEDSADATALNKASIGGKDHQHGLKQSAIPTGTANREGRGQSYSEQGDLPAAVTHAAETAQHRRNISRDRIPASPPQAQNLGLPPATQMHPAGAAAVGTGAYSSTAPGNGPMIGTPENQGRFMENMNVVGRKSEDAHKGPELGMLSSTLASTGPSRGDSLKNKNKGADAGGLGQSSLTQSQGAGEGLSSYTRGDMMPATQVREARERMTGDRDGTSGLLPERMGEDLPASEIARQRELQNAYANQGAREEPRTAARAIGISDPPTNTTSSSPRRDPTQGQQETRRIATQGPAYQTTHVSEPKVISSKTQRFIEHPVPNISHPAPNHPHIHDLFSNIAQPIPHYMFVNYTASICQECVASEQRMWALTHGGEKWRYTYSDPEEEKEMESNDPNTRKTGRESYTDTISILGSSSYNKEGIEQCKCEECLKNRETVKYAAENGLIEKIFNGRRHPASELIETITTTTIVRAPIIQETITTIWCEEPNCSECALKQREYEESRRLELLNKAMNGMVIHETGQSDTYKGYKNLLDVNGANSTRTSTSSSTTFASEGGRKGIERLLKVAGNPRQEGLRRKPGSTAEFDGHIVGYNDDQIVGRNLEQVEPSHEDFRDFIMSGTEGRL